MRVLFQRDWFANTTDSSSEEWSRLFHTRKGTRYKKGIHDIPDNLIDNLPSDAVIVENQMSKTTEKLLGQEALELARQVRENAPKSVAQHAPKMAVHVRTSKPQKS